MNKLSRRVSDAGCLPVHLMMAREANDVTVIDSAGNAGDILEARMVVEFADSQVVEDATNMAFASKDKSLSHSDRVQVRDTLYLALTLDQIRRAGDLNCITVEQAQAVVDQWRRDGCPDTETYQMSAAGAKNYSAGTINSQTDKRHADSIWFISSLPRVRQASIF